VGAYVVVGATYEVVGAAYATGAWVIITTVAACIMVGAAWVTGAIMGIAIGAE